MAKNPLIAKLTKHRHECQWRIPAFPGKGSRFKDLDAGAADTFQGSSRCYEKWIRVSPRKSAVIFCPWFFLLISVIRVDQW
jgi:hypothetical protein